MPLTELPNNLPSCEWLKFYLDDDGHVVVRTSATGVFQPTGLKTGFKITTMNVGTTATKLPLSAISKRNSWIIYNRSATETLFVGPDATVTADAVVGITSGWPVAPLSYFSFDVTDSIDIWGISTQTILVQIMEIA